MLSSRLNAVFNNSAVAASAVMRRLTSVGIEVFAAQPAARTTTIAHFATLNRGDRVALDALHILLNAGNSARGGSRGAASTSERPTSNRVRSLHPYPMTHSGEAIENGHRPSVYIRITQRKPPKTSNNTISGSVDRSPGCIRKCSCAVLHAPALHCIRLRWRRCADAVSS